MIKFYEWVKLKEAFSDEKPDLRCMLPVFQRLFNYVLENMKNPYVRLDWKAIIQEWDYLLEEVKRFLKPQEEVNMWGDTPGKWIAPELEKMLDTTLCGITCQLFLL